MSSLPANRHGKQIRQWLPVFPCAVVVMLAGGCGTTKMNSAKEQLLQSNAVDTAVARIDFTPLRGQRVYFDTQYMLNLKGIGFVNSEYVISSLRQQMIAAGLLIQEKAEDADFIVEGRLGTLGSDAHELIYGIPASNAIGAAGTAMAAASGAPASIPGIPEIALARRNDQAAAAKVAVFAYERVSRARVWQSGISVGRSTANDMWFFGVGPFQKGSIYEGTYFAGDTLDKTQVAEREGKNGPIAGYREPAVFQYPNPIGRVQMADQERDDEGVRGASAEAPAEGK